MPLTDVDSSDGNIPRCVHYFGLDWKISISLNFLHTFMVPRALNAQFSYYSFEPVLPQCTIQVNGNNEPKGWV